MNHLPVSKLIGGLVLWMCVYGCAGESTVQEEPAPSESAGDLIAGLNLGDNEAKVLLFPAPLQVSTTLKLAGLSYEPALLIPVGKPRVYRSPFERSVGTGMLCIDMGYAAVYGDYPSAISYAKQIESILGQMNIHLPTDRSLVDRLQNNTNHPDSIFSIVLETYSHAGQYFHQNGQEDLGLMLMIGCYVEGLYLSLETSRKGTRGLDMLWQQQNLYLDNIFMLLPYFAKEDVSKALLAKLKELRMEMSRLGIAAFAGKIKDPGTQENVDHVKAMVRAIREHLNE
ncbi:MAG: hypothetical protein H6585_14310 [Flavobacteriales bacterium]|nr:hypothetical protein [Flavobacteriales bacterium]MCB9449503.1 hypothetical protein [Flavobacteriales bacterium]